MTDHVTAFKGYCPVCQKASERGVDINIEPFTTATLTPMKRINVDTIGPLPVSEDGYEHILVLIDTFTRWVELIGLRSTDAKEAAQAIMEFLGRYGDPKEFMSDGGPQFVNGLIDEVVRVLAGIEKKVTMAYSKEENAIVERAKRS